MSGLQLLVKQLKSGYDKKDDGELDLPGLEKRSGCSNYHSSQQLLKHPCTFSNACSEIVAHSMDGAGAGS